MKKYKLAICFTTYNRQKDLIKSVHRLLKYVGNNVCICIHNDGGPDDILVDLLSIINNDNIYYLSSKENEGVYRSKIKTLALGCDLANNIIHCDDDDWLDVELLLKYIENNPGVIQFNVSRLIQDKRKLVTRVTNINSSSACLNGLLMNSDLIKNNIKTYQNSELYSYTDIKDSWGDDCIILGELLKGISENNLFYSSEIIAYQEYINTDYHICNNPLVKKRTNTKLKKFLIPLNKFTKI